jgi:hypothetical protein
MLLFPGRHQVLQMRELEIGLLKLLKKDSKFLAYQVVIKRVIYKAFKANQEESNTTRVIKPAQGVRKTINIRGKTRFDFGL